MTKTRKVKKGNTAIIVFVKNLQAGKVKTRLAKDVGDEKALEIYKQLIRINFHHTQNSGLPVLVFYSHWIETDDIWQGSHIEKFVQLKEGDLGDKMKDAFSTALDLYERAIIVGTDCPEITPDILLQAQDLLSDVDVVYGPTFDGGYYLLGMHNLQSPLFENVAWSTETVLTESLRIASKNQLSVELLDKKRDIDYLSDYKALQHLF